jgi:hypothetical protein
VIPTSFVTDSGKSGVKRLSLQRAVLDSFRSINVRPRALTYIPGTFVECCAFLRARRGRHLETCHRRCKQEVRHRVGIARIQPGTRARVLGLLGPNGAGKATLMSILATITRASEGRVSWNGTDIAANPDGLRAVLGYLPQDFGVYPNLNAVEFLEYLRPSRVRMGPARAGVERQQQGI